MGGRVDSDGDLGKCNSWTSETPRIYVTVYTICTIPAVMLIKCAGTANPAIAAIQLAIRFLFFRSCSTPFLPFPLLSMYSVFALFLCFIRGRVIRSDSKFHSEDAFPTTRTHVFSQRFAHINRPALLPIPLPLHLLYFLHLLLFPRNCPVVGTKFSEKTIPELIISLLFLFKIPFCSSLLQLRNGHPHTPRENRRRTL